MDIPLKNTIRGTVVLFYVCISSLHENRNRLGKIYISKKNNGECMKNPAFQGNEMMQLKILDSIEHISR